MLVHFNSSRPFFIRFLLFRFHAPNTAHYGTILHSGRTHTWTHAHCTLHRSNFSGNLLIPTHSLDVHRPHISQIRYVFAKSFNVPTFNKPKPRKRAQKNRSALRLRRSNFRKNVNLKFCSEIILQIYKIILTIEYVLTAEKKSKHININVTFGVCCTTRIINYFQEKTLMFCRFNHIVYDITVITVEFLL